MLKELHQIGFDSAEAEAKALAEYYFNNDYLLKASSFSEERRELFFIGRTGSGKSAILEMIRQKKGDSLRVINITEEDFAVQLLLASPEVSEIPTQFRELTFKTLWKYIIIVNLLKSLYGDEYRWTNLLYGEKKEAYKLLNEFGELTGEQKTFTDQIISFLQRIQEISFVGIGGIKRTLGESRSELYSLFKLLNDFEEKHLTSHLKKKYLYVLIDDLDKNWTGTQDNVDLIRCLFECITEVGRKFHGSVKFVVALRTDIFRQLNFRQTEKIRPYTIEINWYNIHLRRIVELRLTSYWKVSLAEAISRFPRRVRGEEVFDYLIQRTMRRPRDIISFVNLCIEEANSRSSHYISIASVLAAEKRYSRFRLEALIDEWKCVYPELEVWIDLFAGRKFVISYSELRDMLESTNKPVKEVIDILYEVGFLGYRSSEDDKVNFSFVSRGRPGFNHKYHIHVAFFSYLNERAEELGRTVHGRRFEKSQEKQNHEDLSDLLERVLEKFPNSISISKLKGIILGIDPEYNTFVSDYDEFRGFLISIPNVVILYEAQSIVYVKLRQPGDNSDELKKKKEAELESSMKNRKLVVSSQSLEDASSLVKQVLSEYPDGILVGRLKHEMRKIDRKFDQGKLGYRKFTQFLQSIPDIVILYGSNEVTHAKLADHIQEGL